MGKVRKIFVAAMIAAMMIVATACGRNDNGGTSSGSTQGTSAQMTEATTRAESSSAESSEPYVNDVTTGETGGVLQDMVDDVEQGIDNMTDGTTNHSGRISGSAENGGSASTQ